VGPSVDDEDPLAQLRRDPLGDRQSEETGADDEEVEIVLGVAIGRGSHRRQGHRTGPGRPLRQAASGGLSVGFGGHCEVE
jgi:hypothetical protein